MRRCVACRRTAPKTELVRLAVQEGRVVVDRAATLPGRGAYVCGRGCAAAALERRALPRAFRAAVRVDEHLITREDD